MSEATKTSFQFTNFFIKESHFILSTAAEHDEFSLAFDPSGIVFPSLGQFQLQINFSANSKNGVIDIRVVTIAIFQYEGIENIVDSEYFTVNALAIVFPYIRAYISTLTTQSGIEPLILPTLNLSGMAALLKQNIRIEE